MAQGEYKVGEAIEVVYQAANVATGVVVTMKIFDETHAQDLVGFPDVVLTEVGASGRFYGTFTPDAEGNWHVQISQAGGVGEVVKHYAITGYNIDGVGDAVAGLNDIAPGDVDQALMDYDGPTKAELDTQEDNIRGADDDTLKSLSDQLDSVSNPPMVG